MAQLKDTLIAGNLRVTDSVLANNIKKEGGTSSQFLKADGSVDSNSYALSSAIPAAVTSGTVAGWGFTMNTGTLTGVTFNGNSASVSNGVASISATIPTVPDISTNVVSDKASDAKTSSPKSVYNEIHPAVVTSQPAGGMAPNILYDLGTISSATTFTLASPSDANITNHYYWTFEASGTPSITWPSGVSWMGGSAPSINDGKHYEISVLDNYGCSIEI